MKSVDEALLDAKNELFSLPLIQEYLNVKTQIENDKYLVKLDNEVREYQKKMCENLSNDELYIKYKTLYESKDKELKENPLYQNFISLKEEVIALLNQIKDSLQ